MAKLILITGRPGIGKTSLIINLVDRLREKGFLIGGIVSRELRRDKERYGFEILDLLSGKRGLLASIDLPYGPRIGKYKVNLIDLKEIASNSLDKALENCDLIVCDEVGPMELLSPEFKRSIKKALDSGKPLLFSLHHKIRDPIVEELLAKGEVFELTLENRDELKEKVFNRLLDFLK
ncbi:Nucleoside-triphosphatase THEP1 [archaeon HR06]|nr:Nucleoside-triphosphatase THEP1 [archaeon HR06]